MSITYFDTNPLGQLPLCRPQPYRASNPRLRAQIEQLNREQLERLHHRLADKIARGGRLQRWEQAPWKRKQEVAR